jgi:adenylate cyclase
VAQFCNSALLTIPLTFTHVIHRHEGLVDKFIGDAVMAIWGFIPGERDPVQAFSCAKEMVETARRMFFGGKPIMIGIGLNAGQVFIGNVGGEGKRQFTVLGMPVNLTARYQNETKVLDTPIVMGKAFYDRLPPDLQKHLVIHENRLIKGADPQTIYTYTPVNETG